MAKRPRLLVRHLEVFLVGQVFLEMNLIRQVLGLVITQALMRIRLRKRITI